MNTEDLERVKDYIKDLRVRVLIKYDSYGGDENQLLEMYYKGCIETLDDVQMFVEALIENQVGGVVDGL